MGQRTPLRRSEKTVTSCESKNTPLKHKVGSPEIFMSLAMIGAELLSSTEDFVAYLEKYGVGKVAYIPSNEEMISVLLLSSLSIPDYIEIGNNIIKITHRENFSSEQMEIAREIVACDENNG